MTKATKKATQPTPPTPPPSRSRMPLVVGIVGAAVLGVGALTLMRQDAGPVAPAESTAGPGPSAQAAASEPRNPVGPHVQKEFPSLQLPGYALGRPPEVITDAYRFAAEHPEILRYVPCFCGCERSGHKGNDDCFVKARAANGDVVEWEEHGMECNVCLDVAQQAMQMYHAGASVREIRDAVETKWASQSMSHTPTPQPN